MRDLPQHLTWALELALARAKSLRDPDGLRAQPLGEHQQCGLAGRGREWIRLGQSPGAWELKGLRLLAGGGESRKSQRHWEPQVLVPGTSESRALGHITKDQQQIPPLRCLLHPPVTKVGVPTGLLIFQDILIAICKGNGFMEALSYSSPSCLLFSLSPSRKESQRAAVTVGIFVGKGLTKGRSGVLLGNSE